ncbi:hypothetical protein INT47_011914 [Mucor saturninus]|uniref:Phosphatase activator n=1 Tax=Mucor saturninus TaxID=64648 RepID=A0A8H7QT20_9FUNG|nr:hypothetical protein INT47_011914 [Mucor saturninus]
MTTTNDQTNEQHDVDEQLIYSAQQYEEEYDNTTPDAIPQILELDLRGVRVKLDRDTLVSLPESLLIAMFPNGLVLGRSDPNTVDSEEEEHVDSEDEVLTTYVDFDSSCLEYVLQFYQYALETRDEHELQNEGSIFSSSPAAQYYPSLLDKQPIIVLREELEYYCVVSKSKANLSSIKLASGDYLKVQNKVFAALQKNIARENNVAEQHLIDMLCDAGFTRQDVWGHREVEPNRTCIISMSLVLLQTSGPDNHMATAQKLLLFWRKPARKCWWDGNTVDINGESIRLWARRTWTLELALI